MTEGTQPDSDLRESAVPGTAPAPTAGGLLRAAREGQGLHIAALAAAIKVTQRKLEALEGDRLDELPDATFARALAQSICRTLKVDPRPVLDLLPPVGARSLLPNSRVQPSPFRESSDRAQPGLGARFSPLFWLAMVLVLAALVVYFLPADLFKMAPWADQTRVEVVPTIVSVPPVDDAASAAAPAASTAVQPAAAVVEPEPAASAPDVAVAGSETVFSVPTAAAAEADTTVKRTLVITTTDVSWVEVRDSRGQVLISETVAPGRTVGLDGSLPFKLLVGNAAATRITFKGRQVDLNANARENVARFELQ